jgi:Flp pilus assembly protein TadD
MTEGNTTNPRIDALTRMAARNPDDPRSHFGLAAEYERAGDWPLVIRHLETYLRLTVDEGNAWGRLGRALLEQGRTVEARAAYGRGIDAARAHGHPSMAAEFESVVEGLEADH